MIVTNTKKLIVRTHNTCRANNNVVITFVSEYNNKLFHKAQ